MVRHSPNFGDYLAIIESYRTRHLATPEVTLHVKAAVSFVSYAAKSQVTRLHAKRYIAEKVDSYRLWANAANALESILGQVSSNQPSIKAFFETPFHDLPPELNSELSSLQHIVSEAIYSDINIPFAKTPEFSAVKQGVVELCRKHGQRALEGVTFYHKMSKYPEPDGFRSAVEIISQEAQTAIKSKDSSLFTRSMEAMLFLLGITPKNTPQYNEARHWQEWTQKNQQELLTPKSIAR